MHHRYYIEMVKTVSQLTGILSREAITENVHHKNQCAEQGGTDGSNTAARDEEDFARSAKRGLWSGSFDAP